MKERGGVLSDTMCAAIFQEKVHASLAECAALSSHGSAKALGQIHIGAATQATPSVTAVPQPKPPIALAPQSLTPPAMDKGEEVRAQIYTYKLETVCCINKYAFGGKWCLLLNSTTNQAQADLREHLKSLLTSCPWDWSASQLGEFLSTIYPPFDVHKFGCQGINEFIEMVLGSEVQYFLSPYRGNRVILAPAPLLEALIKLIWDIIATHGPLRKTGLKKLLLERGISLYTVARNLEPSRTQQNCLHIW